MFVDPEGDEAGQARDHELQTGRQPRHEHTVRQTEEGQCRSGMQKLRNAYNDYRIPARFNFFSIIFVLIHLHDLSANMTNIV